MTEPPPPMIRRSLSVVVHDSDHVEFRDGVWNARSVTVSDEGRGGRLAAIVEALDGKRTPADAADAAGSDLEEVQAVLDHLRGRGVVEERADNFVDHFLDLVASRATGRNHTGPIRLFGAPQLTVPLRTALGSALPTADVGEPDDDHPLSEIGPAHIAALDDGLEYHRFMERFADLAGSFVVIADTLVDPVRTELVNRVLLHHRVPWMHAALDGPFVTVGPLVLPGRTACWQCYETRVWMNLRESASYQRYKKALAAGRVHRPDDGTHTVLSGLLTAHTVPEALSYVTTGTAVTASQVLSIYVPTMEVAVNEVLPLPGCAACAPQPEADDRELYVDLRTLAEEPR